MSDDSRAWQRFPRLRRVADYCLRLILTAAVVIVAWSTLRALRPVAQTTPSSNAVDHEWTAVDPLVVFAEWDEGSWLTQNGAWTIRTLTANEGPPGSVSPDDAIPPTTVGRVPSAAHGREWLEILDAWGAQREGQGRFTLRRAGSKEWSAVAWTIPSEDGEYLQQLHLTLPWRGASLRFIIEPSVAQPNRAFDGMGMLPMPENTITMATRIDRVGNPCGQVVMGHIDVNALQTLWQQRGWDVRPWPNVSGGYLCRREQQHVASVVSPGPDGRPLIVSMRYSVKTKRK